MGSKADNGCCISEQQMLEPGISVGLYLPVSEGPSKFCCLWVFPSFFKHGQFSLCVSNQPAKGLFRASKPSPQSHPKQVISLIKQRIACLKLHPLLLLRLCSSWLPSARNKASCSREQSLSPSLFTSSKASPVFSVSSKSFCPLSSGNCRPLRLNAC